MPKIEEGANRKTGLTGAANRKAQAVATINAETSAKILAGFDFEIHGRPYHVKYDLNEQQNFADTANACLIAMQESASKPVPHIMWRVYNDDGKAQDLQLTAAEFLNLYIEGALHHKETCLVIGREKKAELK